jgi:acetyl esterase/lipase
MLYLSQNYDISIKEKIVDFEQLLDPAYVAAFQQFPDFATLMTDLAGFRAERATGELAARKLLPPTDVRISERAIPGLERNVPIVIYQPPVKAPRPAFLALQPSGYLAGVPRDDPWSIPFAEHAGCTVVFVHYRLAPEHPFPAAAEDSFAALQWMVDNAGELGIDTKRIAVGGHSAGAGLAAGVALMNRDRGGPNLVLQWLTAPMLDNTHDTPSGHFVTHPKVWNRDVSLQAWNMYLGDMAGGEVSPYASPTRATDLSGLPPAYLNVGALDLFRDETIDYAKRLMAAGVPTELAVYPGVYHSAEYGVPTASVSQRIRRDGLDALKRALM